MWQRQRTPHRSLLLQSLEKLGVMHHSPTLSPLSLCLSPPLFLPLSIYQLRSFQCWYIVLRSHRSFPSKTPPPLICHHFFHHNSLKGGISKSTNGGDLIGKCYKGGGAVCCRLWWLESKGLTLQKSLEEKMQMLALKVSWCHGLVTHYEMKLRRWERPPRLGYVSTLTVTKLLLDTIINVIIFGLLYYLSFSLG